MKSPDFRRRTSCIAVEYACEAPVSVVDKVVDMRGTASLATAYLEYLWSDDGQKLAVQSILPSFR
jgi:sulfate transport system substrate-binding protein